MNYSPVLIAEQLKSVQGIIDENMQVRINTNTNEINAAYIIEDSELDLIIKLSPKYPLHPTEITSGTAGGKQAGISETQWRKWLLSVSSIMRNDVRVALLYFKDNVKAHFDGIEDCAICYAVISSVDRSTPMKKCRTCSNIFHGSCLFKWFKSSGQSSCPLCRQPF